MKAPGDPVSRLGKMREPLATGESAYLFRHAIVRDAAYELQPPGERGALHESAAQVLEQAYATALDPVAQEIAQHWAASGSDPDRERDFTFRAALYAVHTFDHDSAIRLLRRTTIIGTTTQILQAHQMLYSSFRAFRQDTEAAMAEAFALWRAGRRFQEPGAISAALNYMAGLAKDRAIPLLKRSYRLSKRAEKWMPAGIAIGNLGAHYAGLGDFRRACRLIARSITLHRLAGNTVGVGFFLCALSGAHRSLGEFETAHKAAREGVEILEGLDARRYLPSGYGHLASVLEHYGRFQESAVLLDRAIKMAAEIQLDHEWWKLKIHRSLVMLELRQLEQAQRCWAEVRVWMNERNMNSEIDDARNDLQRSGERLKLLAAEAWE